MGVGVPRVEGPVTAMLEKPKVTRDTVAMADPEVMVTSAVLAEALSISPPIL